MRNLRKSVLVVCVIASLVPLNVPAQDLTAGQADSLVSYIELLERDLWQCEIVGMARQDSLKVKLDVLSYRLEIAREEKARWYQDPRLWFLFGAASAVMVIGATVQVTF